MPAQDMTPHTQEAALLLEVLAELKAIRVLLTAAQHGQKVAASVAVPPPTKVRTRVAKA